MALICWSTEYSVEVDSIDKQHQKLFAMLNGLHDAMKVGKGSQRVPLILGELVQYTREHFASEENLMLRAGYPDYDRHKAEHDKLTRDVMQMVRDFEQGKIALTMRYAGFPSPVAADAHCFQRQEVHGASAGRGYSLTRHDWFKAVHWSALWTAGHTAQERESRESGRCIFSYHGILALGVCARRQSGSFPDSRPADVPGVDGPHAGVALLLAGSLPLQRRCHRLDHPGEGGCPASRTSRHGGACGETSKPAAHHRQLDPGKGSARVKLRPETSPGLLSHAAPGGRIRAGSRPSRSAQSDA